MRAMRILAGLVFGVMCGFPGLVMAQPAQKPMTVIVPFGPGGSTDLLVRVVAANITSQTGQTVVVENRPGAGGYLRSIWPPARLPTAR